MFTRHKSAQKSSLSIFLSTLLMVTLLPLVNVLTAKPAEAAVASSDKAFKASGTQYLATGTNSQVVPSNSNFTAQMWVRPDKGIIAYARMMSQGASNASMFKIERTNAYVAFWKYGVYQDNARAIIPENTWTHIAFSFSTTNGIKLYTNGVVTYTCAACKTAQTLGSNFMVGTDSTDPLNQTYHLWRGGLDEVRVYKSERTQAEIQSDMESYGETGNPSLVAYYDFNAGTGSTVANMSTSASKAADLGVLVRTSATTSQTGNVTTEDIATETTSGTEKILKFSRTFITADGGWTVPDGAAKIKALVVGGGGGGGSRHGGGGGAGGFTEISNRAVIQGENLKVKVGFAGRPGVDAGNGHDGGSSEISGATFSKVEALGGGGGGGGTNTGRSGGSGGGGGASYAAGGAGTTGQGNAGSKGIFGRYDNGGENWLGGGGGGAGGAGVNAVWAGNSSKNGRGGDGKSVSWITPTIRTALGGGQDVSGTVYFAGGGAGGGGSWFQPQIGGYGGGGSYNGGFATENTGGGGGGLSISNGWAGSGGSGVVYISYSTVPNTPTGLIAVPISDTKVSLSWNPSVPNDAILSDYVIEQSPNGSSGWTVVDDGVNLNTSYTVTGLTQNTTYYFRVSAKNLTSTSPPTANVVNVTTWIAVGSGQCIQYVSSANSVSSTLSGDSCVVTFDENTNWAVPQGATKLDALVVGGGGGGGAQAGSGGGGGSIAEVKVDLGASKISQLSVSIGAGGSGGIAGGSGATAGSQSVLASPAGTNNFSVTSPGGNAGTASSSNTAASAPAAAAIPTISKTGTDLTLTEIAKNAGGVGGAGRAWTPFTSGTSNAGLTGTGGYSNSTIFTGNFGGGGGGGPVSFSSAAPTLKYAVAGTGELKLVFDENLENFTSSSEILSFFKVTANAGQVNEYVTTPSALVLNGNVIKLHSAIIQILPTPL